MKIGPLLMVAAMAQPLAAKQVTAPKLPAREQSATRTQIGAIELPEPVRKRILMAYKGYQFGETVRVDRPAPARRLFEVHLEKPGEKVVVTLDATGKELSRATKLASPPAPPAWPVTGTWHGEAVCLVDSPDCYDEVVVYRVAPATTSKDSTAFDIQMNRIANNIEAPRGLLACTLEHSRAMLLCVVRSGAWQFRVGRDSLVGDLTLDGGIAARHVRLKRQP